MKELSEEVEMLHQNVSEQVRICARGAALRSRAAGQGVVLLS